MTKSSSFKAAHGQQGNILLLACFLTASAGALGLLFLQKEAALALSLKRKLRVFLCMKDLNGSALTHVKRMELLNRGIETANAAMLAAGASPAALAAARTAKKAAQGMQQASHFFYLKNLVQMSANKCFFNPGAYRTPYRHKGLLERDVLGRAKLWKRKWTQTSFGKGALIRSKARAKLRGGLEMETESWIVQEGALLLKRPWRSFLSVP